jgi:fibronectin type 3 domain-containing protein
MSRGSIARMLIEDETTKELTENNKITYRIYRKDNSKESYKTILSIIWVT